MENIKSETQNLRTWVEIDKSAIKNNYKIFRRIIGEKRLLMSIVKSNAYGHGLIDISQTMQNLGADWLGVDSITEAIALRENKIKIPILVLGYTLPSRYLDAVKNNINITISSFDGLKNLEKFSKKYKTIPRIHLKIDTGMHRQGFLPEEIETLTDFIKEKLSLKNIEGTYTHFAAAKNPSFPTSTEKQLQKFEKAVSQIKSAGVSPITHAAATSGTLLFPQSHLDMVRIGIGMYGLWPSKEAQTACQKNINLKPVLSWKTIISEIKILPSKSKIGYDFTETLNKKSTIAICPIGYWHGYPRNLSGIGKVLISGKLAKILGRISMDMIVVDISKIPNAKIGQEVFLIGKDKNGKISAEQLADLSGTMHYEIITRINPLIKKLYI